MEAPTLNKPFRCPFFLALDRTPPLKESGRSNWHQMDRDLGEGCFLECESNQVVSNGERVGNTFGNVNSLIMEIEKNYGILIIVYLERGVKVERFDTY